MTTARAAGRTLSVTPATGLADQVVLAQWTGFRAANGVIVQQCKSAPTSLADCETAQPFPNSENGNEVVNGVTQSDGTGEAFIEVRPAASLPSLDCSEANPCSLIAYENDGRPIPPDGLPTTAVVAPIAFASSPADCPQVTNYDVRAEGEASGSAPLYHWIAGLCNANPKLILDYTETSSVSGREDFLANEVDVGVTSTPATESELAAAKPTRAFAYAPLDLTAIAVVYNIADPTTGKRVTDLTLSPRLLTRLITDTGLLDFFNDPELKRLNPDHDWPTNGVSVPLIRAERNADTLITTSWMASDPAAEQFLHGTDPDGVAVQPAFKDYPYPTDVFEDVDSNTAYVPRQGQNEVAQRVFYGVTPTGGSAVDTSQYGFIGLVDLPTALRFDLPIAKLVNATRNAVAPDGAGVAAGYAAMKVGTDGVTRFPNFASTDPAAYPLVKVDYGMVPTSDGATLAGNLKRLLQYVTGPGQQNLAPGLFPLPSALVTQTTAAADAIKVAIPPPTTTPTTTPVTTPPPGDLGYIPPVEPSATSDGGSSTDTPANSAPTTTAPRGTDKSHPAPAKSTPVVNLATAGERFGLPIIAILALLALLYPARRRGAHIARWGMRRWRRRDRGLAVSKATESA